MNLPLLTVTALSAVVALVMVYVFQFASDQRAIKIAKDRLKAHLLAVRLYQDQLSVVINSYGRIMRGTTHYLRLALVPFLIVIVPVTLIIVEADRYLGSVAFLPSQPFLVVAKLSDSTSLEQTTLVLPDGIISTSPPVHVAASNEVAWRLSAQQAGDFEIRLNVGDSAKVSKHLVVSSALRRLSPERSQGSLFNRYLHSTEPLLQNSGPVQSITINYPSRNISAFGFDINWILLFFVLSMVFGFIFKSILGIEI